MSPGQDTPAAIEKTVIMLAVSASKIVDPREGLVIKTMVSVRGMALVFWARRFSPASTRFSNTFLKVLLSLLRMANVGCHLDQGPVGKITVSSWLFCLKKCGRAAI